jgi:hypothetical protein
VLYIWSTTYLCEGNPLEIQTPKQWNLIGRSMTHRPTLGYSSTIFLSLRLNSRNEKFGALLKNVI